jgi:hypothetical protein
VGGHIRATNSRIAADNTGHQRPASCQLDTYDPRRTTPVAAGDP